MSAAAPDRSPQNAWAFPIRTGFFVDAISHLQHARPEAFAAHLRQHIERGLQPKPRLMRPDDRIHPAPCRSIADVRLPIVPLANRIAKSRNLLLRKRFARTLSITDCKRQ